MQTDEIVSENMAEVSADQTMEVRRAIRRKASLGGGGTTQAYTEQLAKLAGPIIEQAQADLVLRIADKFGLNVEEVLSSCLQGDNGDVGGGGGGGGMNCSRDEGRIGSKRKEPTTPKQAGMPKRMESGHKRGRMKADRSFKLVQKVLDGTDEVLKNLLAVDEANDVLVGKEGLASQLNANLKKAVTGADQTMVELARNVSALADLLHSVYPPHVVEKLSGEVGDIADIHPSVSVFMCDIVGFTDWCSTTPPNKVIECLSSYFQLIDDIAETRNVYKVETIGDGYQAICGHDDKTPDHAERMTAFALDVLALVPLMRRIFECETFNIRIGIHSGPLVTGVIRADRPRWQLFGDTVNVSARMESTCIPGKVQISRQTYDLLIMSNKFKTERRGVIPIKGKGDFETFFVTGCMNKIYKRPSTNLHETLDLDQLTLAADSNNTDSDRKKDSEVSSACMTVSDVSNEKEEGKSKGKESQNLDESAPKVLLVDDMLSVILQLARTMQKSNIGVTTARNGKDALEILYKDTFTTVFCDIHMPGMTGIEMVQSFREWEKNNRLFRQRIYALTGDTQAQENYLNAGFDGTISKTSSKHELIDFVVQQ